MIFDKDFVILYGFLFFVISEINAIPSAPDLITDSAFCSVIPPIAIIGIFVLFEIFFINFVPEEIPLGCELDLYILPTVI